MVICLLVLLFLDPKNALGFSRCSCLFFTLPKTTCLPSSNSVSAVPRKNWEPFVLSSICPGQDARMCIIHDKVFILKFLPIDGRAARAIMACEVATLSYESWDNCVRRGTLLSKSFLFSTQSTRLWSLELCKQLEGDVAQGLAMSENTVGMSLAAASGNRGQRRLQSPYPACLQDSSLCNLFLLKVRR